MWTDDIPEKLVDQLRFYAEHVEEIGEVATDYGMGTRGTEALVAEGLMQAAEEIDRLVAALELAATWGIRSKGFDAQTAHELGHWVDGGMKGEPPKYLLGTSDSKATGTDCA